MGWQVPELLENLAGQETGKSSDGQCHDRSGKIKEQ